MIIVLLDGSSASATAYFTTAKPEKEKLAFNNLIINTFFASNYNIEFVGTVLISLWSFLYSSVSVQHV